MSPITMRFSQMLRWATVIVLSCTAVFAQDSTKVPAQKPTAPAQNDKSQLPDEPVPSKVSSSAQTPETAQPQSSSAAPQISISTDPNAQITVLENTMIRVMTNAPLGSRQTREGAPLLFTLSEDVVVDNVLIIPRGATVHGTAVQSKKAGTLTGSPDLILKLVSLDLGGRSYPLYSYQFKVEGTSKTKPTESKVKGGALIGALVGGAFSGSAKGETTAVGKLAGMGTGAAIGAGVGTMVSAATPGPSVTIPAESQMDFYLASPISVVPASAKEAAQLAQGYHHGGPVLYVRGDTP
jgi:hypothetical protein